MKKIIFLLFFILFLTTGCYDYIELNELAIVSGISIDYQEDEYHVAYEILNAKNQEQSQEKEKVYLAKGKGKTIADAFYDTSLQIAKVPYLAHLKSVIIDEEIARKHVEEIIDFLIRDNYIRNIFMLVLAKDQTAYDILKNHDTNNPVVSTAIKDLIESTSYKNNIASTLNFEKFITNIIDPRKDTFITSIELKNGNLKLGPLAIFHKYNMKEYLTENESATFNLLNSTSKENYFKVSCPNDDSNFILLSSYDTPKSEASIKQNTVTLSTEIEVKIIENHCDMDFKEASTYQKIQKELNKKLEHDMQELMEVLLENNSDVLKIKQLYYQTYKKDQDFRNLQYKYKANAIINRNGLIYEVKQ